MPWLEIDHLHISPDVWAKLLDKHGIDAAALRAMLLERRRFPFRWRTDHRGTRAILETELDGRVITVILYPWARRPPDWWHLATAYRI